MMLTLNVIGGGKVGQTLAYLWQQHAGLKCRAVLNRQYHHAQAAVNFIGSGQPVTEISALPVADVYLLTVPDDAMASVVEQLLAQAQLTSDTIVVHCSGALSSEILRPLSTLGVAVMSAHPLLSFPSVEQALTNVAGSYCTIEGDSAACQVVAPLLQQIGVNTVQIEAEDKLIYHAACVMLSNYLVTLVDAGLKTLQLTAVPEAQGRQMIQPLLHSVLAAVAEKTPAQALTGPIARGDSELVARQWQQLQARDVALAELYQQLGQHCVALAEQRGLEPSRIAALKRALSP